MFIGTVWYRAKSAAKSQDYMVNLTVRGETGNEVAQRCEVQARALRANYDVQCLVGPVTHEVVPPELDVKLVPFKG